MSQTNRRFFQRVEGPGSTKGKIKMCCIPHTEVVILRSACGVMAKYAEEQSSTLTELPACSGTSQQA